jgi:SsrA-binding protein
MKNIASNKNAKRNYEILKTFEAGIELFGTEVKSISKSNCSINEAYIMINNSEAFIMNMHVANFFEGNIQNKDPLRNRKLLLHKNEIVRLDFDRKKESLTIIPIKLY